MLLLRPSHSLHRFAHGPLVCRTTMAPFSLNPVKVLVGSREDEEEKRRAEAQEMAMMKRSMEEQQRRVAEQRADEELHRRQRRARGIMHDEEQIEGRTVYYNYTNEFNNMRGYDLIHWKMRRVLIIGGALGILGFFLAKFDLTKKRRKRMMERQKRLREEQQKRMQEMQGI